MKRQLIGLIVTMGLLPAIGCGSGTAEGGQVTGVVTLDGQPVAKAKVTFYKSDDSNGSLNIITALTDEMGKYSLFGDDPSYRGTPVGDYKVTVYKLVPIKNAKLPEDADPEQIEVSGQGKNILPPKAANLQTTTITATVKDGPNTVDIALKSK